MLGNWSIGDCVVDLLKRGCRGDTKFISHNFIEGSQNYNFYYTNLNWNLPLIVWKYGLEVANRLTSAILQVKIQLNEDIKSVQLNHIS